MTPATACSVRVRQRSRQRGCRARGSMRRATRASTSLCCARSRRSAQTAAARAEQVRQPQVRFADDDVALDEDVVARETAGALKGMVVGGEAKTIKLNKRQDNVGEVGPACVFSETLRRRTSSRGDWWLSLDVRRGTHATHRRATS